jgi:hypothetical protein
MNKKHIAYICFGGLVLLGGYLVLNPVLLKPLTVLPRHIPNLEAARNYYSVVSSILGVIVGVAGLTLGCFYYHNRNSVEADNKKRDLKRRRMEVFIDELDTYDNLIHRILTLSINNEQELRLTRAELTRSFELIESMLEQGLDLLGFDTVDMNEILKVNSYIDKCNLIMHSRFDELDLSHLYPIKDRYVELIKNARRKCYLKIV